MVEGQDQDDSYPSFVENRNKTEFFGSLRVYILTSTKKCLGYVSPGSTSGRKDQLICKSDVRVSTKTRCNKKSMSTGISVV